MGVVNWEPNIGFSGNFRSLPEDFCQNHQSMGTIQLLIVGNSGHSDGAAGTFDEAAFSLNDFDSKRFCC